MDVKFQLYGGETKTIRISRYDEVIDDIVGQIIDEIGEKIEASDLYIFYNGKLQSKSKSFQEIKYSQEDTLIILINRHENFFARNINLDRESIIDIKDPDDIDIEYEEEFYNNCPPKTSQIINKNRPRYESLFANDDVSYLMAIGKFKDVNQGDNMYSVAFNRLDDIQNIILHKMLQCSK